VDVAGSEESQRWRMNGTKRLRRRPRSKDTTG
jgi:hypothetical protein